MDEQFYELFKDKEHAALAQMFVQHHVLLEKRVRSLEIWRWMQAGGALLIGAFIPFLYRMMH